MAEPMQAVVIAGGLGTRMRPHTEHIPKALLDVAGRPFVDWLLERIAAHGYREVIFCIGHLGHQLREHVGDGGRYGLQTHFVEDGPRLLGTAGALRAALPLLAPTFLVTYGDSYLPFDYAEPLGVLNAQLDCDGVMSVYRNLGQWDRSNTHTDGTWVLEYEKGTHDPAFEFIDYGALALRREVVAALAAGDVTDLAVVQAQLARARRLRAVVARQRFYEIGSPEGLLALSHHLGGRT